MLDLIIDLKAKEIEKAVFAKYVKIGFFEYLLNT